ncbi:substrate-binding periplasmic protein [Roseateles noduli]|uniref:substrate-binding periplasmic protein n=1 Tax=Roseateles noduli TaxID=2052484 RepID=UPI003D645FBC
MQHLADLALTAGQPLKRRSFLGAALVAATPAVAQSGRVPPVVPLALSEAVDATFLTPILTVVEQAAKLRWERSAVPFSRLLRLVERGETIGFGVSPTEERSERLSFSVPLFRGAIWTVSRRDRQLDVRHVDDLRGRVVCMSRMATYGNALANPAADGLDVRPVAGDLSRRLRTLEAGHCDVLLVTSFHGSADSVHARLRAAGGNLQTLQVGRQPLSAQDVHFAVAKDSPLATWLPRIDSAIGARRKEIQRLVSLGDG